MHLVLFVLGQNQLADLPDVGLALPADLDQIDRVLAHVLVEALLGDHAGQRHDDHHVEQ